LTASDEADGPDLSSSEMARYSRQMVIPEVGSEGQMKLKSGSVLVVGVGGLGAPAATYLAAAGVGRIGLVDRDEVEVSNLQRQTLYSQKDVGMLKVTAAADRLREMNPEIKVVRHNLTLDSSNAMEVLGGYDIVIDGTDTFPTRYLINDACALLGKPDVYASVLRFDGQASVFDASRGPCYRCLFPRPPPPGSVPSCAEAGVVGVLTGIMGSVQAAQAINILLGVGSPLTGRLLVFDARNTSFTELRIKKNPGCPLCGNEPSITKLIDYDDFCGISKEAESDEVSPLAVKQWIDSGRGVSLLDVREPFEFRICRLEGAELLPLRELPRRFADLDKDAEYVVYCHTGVRSRTAVGMMKAAGFRKARNLTGGISAWADQVDPGMPRY
jgi:sulfur-carrier protein adenylyltransferase/sulfurtransferase